MNRNALRVCARCGAKYQGSKQSRYCSAGCKQGAYYDRQKRKVKA